MWSYERQSFVQNKCFPSAVSSFFRTLHILFIRLLARQTILRSRAGLWVYCSLDVDYYWQHHTCKVLRLTLSKCLAVISRAIPEIADFDLKRAFLLRKVLRQGWDGEICCSHLIIYTQIIHPSAFALASTLRLHELHDLQKLYITHFRSEFRLLLLPAGVTSVT